MIFQSCGPEADFSKLDCVDVDTMLAFGDCLQHLWKLKEGSVDMVLTDPPYSSGGLHASARQKTTGEKYLGNTRYPDFGGDQRDQRAWYRWCLEWIGHCHHVLRDGGYMLAFCDWRQLPTLTDAMQGAGIIWRGLIAWDKLNARAGHTGFFIPQCEFIVWGTKGPIEKRPPGSTALKGCYSIAPPHHTRRKHQTEKPLELLAKLIEAVPPGALVLDPFCGSGSTGVAALQSGRKFLGCEASPHYYDVAKKRLTEVLAH